MPPLRPIEETNEHWASMTSERQAQAIRKYMRTSRPDQVCLDLYFDASGDDNWSASPESWYILASIAVRKSHRWKQYREWHASFPDGLHLAVDNARKQGPSGHDLVREIFNLDPWEQAIVTVVHKSSLKSAVPTTLLERPKGQPDSHMHAEFIWPVIIGSTCEALSNENGRCHLGTQRIGKVAVNHPGRGDPAKRAIRTVLISAFKKARSVEFLAGGDPGVDLADGIAWAARRLIVNGETHQFPFGVDHRRHRFAMNFCVGQRQFPCVTLRECQEQVAALQPPNQKG